MHELLEQSTIDANLIRDLRAMAERGARVRELVGTINGRLGFKDDAIIPIVCYFTEAFCVTLPEVLPIREWIGTVDDAAIDAIILPVIARTRAKWTNNVSADPRVPSNDVSSKRN